MGDRARKRREFLAQHPFCCFCGRATPATTTDHVPSRQLFSKKRWPEGYEFPACDQCNAATKDDEQVVAMLARVHHTAATQDDQHETSQIIAAVGRNYPAILIEMQPTARKIREFLKERGIKKDPNKSTVEYPLLVVGGPRASAFFAAFRESFAILGFVREEASI